MTQAHKSLTGDHEPVESEELTLKACVESSCGTKAEGVCLAGECDRLGSVSSECTASLSQEACGNLPVAM